ncbi:MAG: NigD-like protein [Prevotellaceae bacterium]|nr:NigD-like protein [Prevotellaceae bacterium]
MENETGYYSDSFGVVRLSGDRTLYFKTDEGEVLIPNQNVSSFVEAGDRVWLSYTVEEESANLDTLTISPYRITRVMPLELQSESKLKNDGINLWTVWVAQDFLTFDFRIRANDPDKLKDHEYALVAPQKEIVDTLFISFIHDAGNDSYGTLSRTAVTLKLDELKMAKDSVILAIDYRSLEGAKQTEYRMYRKTKK